MRISIFQPDIPQNLGALLRVSACLSMPLDIIEPCGFAFSEKKLRRTAMDYISQADFRTFIDYQAFKDAGDSARKALGKIFNPKNLQTKKKTKTGRISAGS